MWRLDHRSCMRRFAGNMVWLLIAVVSLSALVLAAPGDAMAQTDAKRVALVIGNADYDHAGKLTNTRNDARLVAESLRAAGFTIIRGAAQLDLRNDGMRDAVRDFGRALGANTVAVFYYSGHGIEYEGENYLIPIDANPNPSDVLDLVPVRELTRQIEQKHNGMAIIILDACRTNPFPKGKKDIVGGLAQMQAPRGTLIAFATQPGASASDGTGGNSPYAKVLADEIRTPGLDLFNTFNEVARRVDEETGHNQIPWLSSSPITGRFFFVPPVPPLAVVPPPAPPLVNSPFIDNATVTQLLKAELRRVGCYMGTVDGNWDRQVSGAIALFNRHSKTALDVAAASVASVRTVSSQSGRVCPLECPSGQKAAGDRCVPVHAVRAETSPRPPSETRNSSPSARGSHCEQWGGQTFCE